MSSNTNIIVLPFDSSSELLSYKLKRRISKIYFFSYDDIFRLKNDKSLQKVFSKNVLSIALLSEYENELFQHFFRSGKFFINGNVIVLVTSGTGQSLNDKFLESYSDITFYCFRINRNINRAANIIFSFLNTIVFALHTFGFMDVTLADFISLHKNTNIGFFSKYISRKQSLDVSRTSKLVINNIEKINCAFLSKYSLLRGILLFIVPSTISISEIIQLTNKIIKKLNNIDLKIGIYLRKGNLNCEIFLYLTASKK